MSKQETPKSKTAAEKKSVESFESIASEVAELKDTLARQADNDGVQQKAFDQLYEELRQYKEDFVFQNEKSLLLDLLLFYDSVNWFQQSLIKKEMSPDVIADSFQYLIDELLELLYRRDVLPMEASDRFDRKVHKVIKTVPAPTPEEDYDIHQVLKRGFTRGSRVLRAEEVVVKRTSQSNPASE
ncbi:MAG: nucleotide exchange factor GrpE [Deltaproteobacteria bacterium]|nr:nucleotide exchange factor GrpE [Deltaproteobacteria bacterium]